MNVYKITLKSGGYMYLSAPSILIALQDNGLSLQWFDTYVEEWDFA